MKFPFKIPSHFPRLRFSVYDMNTFGSDDAIGESVISVKK